jgi:hypothetical protein
LILVVVVLSSQLAELSMDKLFVAAPDQRRVL